LLNYGESLKDFYRRPAHRANDRPTGTKTARIRALNDELRQNFAQGPAVLTPGVAALGPAVVERIVKTIAVFDDFCQANDPYEEHDFGSFDADGHRIFFKIDYLDQSMSMHSPDPADPSVTQRVITIMLAEEYMASLCNCGYWPHGQDP
jgi:Protein of unknown function (DUF3768)